MTIFNTQEGFNAIAFELSEESYFGLQKGFNSIAFELSEETYFGLQKGFNAIDFDIDISVGVLQLDGDAVDFNGVAFVSSGGIEYSVNIVNGRFPIYPFYDEFEVIQECFIVADAGVFVGELTVTPTAADFYFIPLTDSTGMASKVFDIEVIQAPVVIQNRALCVCDLSCEYVEKVFAGANNYETDKSSFLYKKLRSSDSIAIELQKKGRKVADLNDNTLGVYYSTFAVQPLYVGFVIDWGLVFTAFGGGDYRIVANKVILGASSTDTSRAFYLNSFDDESANGTVKLSINLNGNILSSIFDYTDLIAGGWVSNYRIPAKFGNKTPELTTDNYLSSSREKINVVPSVSYEYTLQTRLIPAVIADELNANGMLSDRVLVTDYNILNPRRYVDFEAYPTGIELVEEADDKEIYSVTFSDRFDNTRRTY